MMFRLAAPDRVLAMPSNTCMHEASLRDMVYGLLCKIPKGRVTTYGEIARALSTQGYRAIGMILHRNPDAPRVPCHRVVMSDGRLGGYVAGAARKRELLTQEGVVIKDGRIVDFATTLFTFS